MLLCILCWKQSVLVAFLVSFCTDFVISVWRKKNSSFLFFFLLLFLTYQTPKPNRTELKPNAIGWFGIPSLQVGFGAQYVKTEVLGLVQKLSWTPTELNQTNYNPRLYIIYWCLVWDIVFPGSNLCLLLSFSKKMSTPFVLQLCIAANILMERI